MRIHAGMAAICGVVLMLHSGAPEAEGKASGDACSFLSRDRISTMLELSIDAGQHIGPGKALCGWGDPDDPHHTGKHVLLTMYRAVGKITPVERFENGKMPIGGIEKTPVTGIYPR